MQRVQGAEMPDMLCTVVSPSILRQDQAALALRLDLGACILQVVFDRLEKRPHTDLNWAGGQGSLSVGNLRGVA